MTYGNTTYYYITDANKNVVCLLSGYSSAADYQYGPWGEIRDIEGTAAYWNPFRFSSEFYDDETGLVYYNYRYYAPALGRWLSRDPIGEEGGMNLYAMIKNNTINHYDITGLLDLDKTPFYVGFRKLEEKDLLDRIANMIAFTHVDILEEKGGKYEFLRFGFGANKNLSTELLELKEYKFRQLYLETIYVLLSAMNLNIAMPFRIVPV